MRPTVLDQSRRKLQAGARSLVRRLRVAGSKGVRWALEGHEDLAGNVEADKVEIFPGVGFFARPKAGHRVEAIVLKVGGESGHPVIVATRNQDGIRVIGELGEDETAIFTSQAVVKIAADGTVEIGSIGGSVAALATKADLDRLLLALTNAAVTAGDGGASFKAAVLAALTDLPPWPAGTTKLRAE